MHNSSLRGNAVCYASSLTYSTAAHTPQALYAGCPFAYMQNDRQFDRSNTDACSATCTRATHIMFACYSHCCRCAICLAAVSMRWHQQTAARAEPATRLLISPRPQTPAAADASAHPLLRTQPLAALAQPAASSPTICTTRTLNPASMLVLLPACQGDQLHTKRVIVQAGGFQAAPLLTLQTSAAAAPNQEGR